MPLDRSRIRALCFDVDGTLSDTDDQWVERFERALRPASRLFPGGQVRPFCRWAVMGMETPGNFAYHLLDRLDLDVSAARLFDRINRTRIFHPAPGLFWLMAGVKELLVSLAARFPMAVVSARDEASTRRFLEQFELTRYFTSIVCAQTCRHTKPYPDPVLHAAAEMGVRAEECLMTGDTVVDIRAGKAAGAQTAGVLCGFGRQAELLRAGADVILPATADLLAVLC